VRYGALRCGALRSDALWCGGDTPKSAKFLYRSRTTSMSIAGLLLGIINIAIVVVILLLIGAIALWFLGLMGWPVPWNVQRLYMAIVALVALYMLAALLLGIPTVRIVGSHLSEAGATLVASRPCTVSTINHACQ
jgi:hypothetical protein